jgi:hypothetical protein
MAVVALFALILPFETFSYRTAAAYLVASTSVAGSASLFDAIQRPGWTAYLELMLMVGGGVAAAVTALIRLVNPKALPAMVTLLGFTVMAAGYVWIYVEWGDQAARLAGYYSNQGLLDLKVQPGYGFWAGLAVAVFGGLVCLGYIVDRQFGQRSLMSPDGQGAAAGADETGGPRRWPPCS